MDYIKLLELVYVDDIIFGSTKKELCNAFEKLMHENFQMSSMRELTFFLGLQVQQKKDGIFISQDKYVVEILKKFGFTEVKTASIPMETQKPLLKDEDGEEVDVHMYRSMIGSLMYLTSLRSDIIFAVCACARYQVNPKVSYFYDVKRIFSDYAGASLDKKSTIGGCQFLGCRLISWQCKKQIVVANSTTEAEYVAASSCCGQVLWIQNQLLDYGTINREVQLHALVDDKKVIISEASMRRDLKLEDEEGIDYEAVYKELGDSLMRAATNASSLEAEQDSGNITKTRSKASPNESSSLGTTSGGGPRCQETIGDTIAQTRFENKVLDLEKTKTTQANEIASLKRRVKKLKQKKRSRTHELKRLRKLGATARVESSGDEENLGEDASKQGRRINAIDADEDITLVSVQDDANKELFDVDTLNGEEVFVAGQNKNVVEEIVNANQVNTDATTVTITTEEITLAQALEALKTSKPKVKGIVLQEPAKVNADYQLAERLQAEEQEQFIIEEKATLFKELLEQRRKHFAAKRAEEKRNKPPTKTQQKKIMITYLKNMKG
ncbi:uncharacterized mitochondrial protein-like protein [Tanacetum coccineum]